MQTVCTPLPARSWRVAHHADNRMFAGGVGEAIWYLFTQWEPTYGTGEPPMRGISSWLRLLAATTLFQYASQLLRVSAGDVVIDQQRGVMNQRDLGAVATHLIGRFGFSE